MLHLVPIERKGGQLFVGKEIKRDRLVLKALRPNFSDLAQAGVDVGDFVLHLEAVDLERGVGEHILDEVGQTHAVVLHFAEDFELLRSQRSELLRQQQMQVASHDRQRRLQLVRGGGKRIAARGAMMFVTQEINRRLG